MTTRAYRANFPIAIQKVDDIQDILNHPAVTHKRSPISGVHDNIREKAPYRCTCSKYRNDAGGLKNRPTP